MAERINQPADPHHHWRFRLHFDVHELLKASDLNVAVEGLVKDSRRAA